MHGVLQKYENPIDKIILSFVDNTVHVFTDYQINPNIFTLLSFIFGISSIYLINKSVNEKRNLGYYREKFASLLLLTSYIFNFYYTFYAHKYNLISKNGDKYNNASNIIILVAIAVVLRDYVKKYLLQISGPRSVHQFRPIYKCKLL